MERGGRSAVVEHFNMRTEPLEDRPETVIQELGEDSAETRSQSLPPASGSSEDQLRSFVTLLMEKILTECHVLEDQSQKNRVTYIKHLVNLTMEGLSEAEGVSPDMKYIDKICEAVLSDLKKKFCGRRLLETQVLSQNPDFDAAAVQSVQTHIKAQFAKKDQSCRNMLITVSSVVTFAYSIYKLVNLLK